MDKFMNAIETAKQDYINNKAEERELPVVSNLKEATNGRVLTGGKLKG